MALRIGYLSLFVMLLPYIFGETLVDLLKKTKGLTKVAEAVAASTLLELELKADAYTAFLPSDDALEGYEGAIDREFVHAHMTKTPLLIQNASAHVISRDVKGNPQFFLSSFPTGNPSLTGYEHMTYYVDNAEVVVANLVATSEGGNQQVLHVLDRPLPPLRPVGAAVAPVQGYPTALDLLAHPATYGLTGDLSIGKFYKRVKELGALDAFKLSGENTFFVAVDRALNPPSQLLDPSYVHGHVAPGTALFTRPASIREESKPSMAFADNLKVSVKMHKVEHHQALDEYYVTSETLIADEKHREGSSMARIVKANIPVMNGVVHLIDRPLMTIASSIGSYLDQNTSQLSLFSQLLKEFHPDLNAQLTAADPTAETYTIFAPSNEAIKSVNKNSLDMVKLNSEKIKELLRLHIVKDRITTRKIIEESKNGRKYSSPTLSLSRSLYFTVSPNEEQRKVFVDGAGVNASISTGNILTKNGIIHIIDRILDIPDDTVFKKLQSNGDTSTSFELSKQGNFNKQFKDRKKLFTFFVPNNAAWEAIKHDMPSAYKKIFMPKYDYFAKEILERHMIVGKALPIKEIAAITNNHTLQPDHPDYAKEAKKNATLLEMTRGGVYFSSAVTRNGNDYYLDWHGRRARVVQADLECVNGVIHVIDRAMMIQPDVTAAASTAGATLATFLATLATAWLL